ncbi:uncharacterized protein LODBEIA_P44940 [Lodderomyces beijingensis]|uniref:RNA polymerase I-specific transcription initiation factor RRN3 n=1 Tax=Lodderomyces beijingensis TaxID=1775926 RepID=A0ABP0ZQ40_9ASCO
MSLHDPITRKRDVEVDTIEEFRSNKRLRSEKLPQSSSEMISSNKSAAGNDKTKRSIMSQPDNDFSKQMFYQYVKTAFTSLEKDDSLQIDTLTDKINLPSSSPDAITLAHFSIILKALIHNTSKLDNRACSNLIFAILRYKWLEVQEESSEEYSIFKDLYSHFLTVLVSTLPKFLSEVLNKLVQEFETFNPSDEVLPSHHIVLRKILKFIPLSINSIPQILQGNFPHHISSSTSEVLNYVHNLLKITEYSPELQFSVWQLIVECCIKIDVELQNELDDLDDDEIEELINGKEDDMELLANSDNDEDENIHHRKEVKDVESQGEDADADADVDGEVDGEVEWIDPTNSTQNIKQLSSKLDSIVHLLLSTTSTSFTDEEISNGNGVTLFNTINSLFKSHILPTHFTKSIQFLLFHITQYQPELADSFLVLLIDVAFNPSEIVEKRLKAMQYLSSYIARAKNLSRHQIVFIVSYLMGWINKYIIEREQETLDREKDNKKNKNNESNRQTGGMERFKLFYSAFQALLYIFCFRHETLRKQDNNYTGSADSEWECDLDKFFQRVIIARFNPLKFCDETVVYIFAKLATKLNVCYCYSIIEHNKRERMLQTNGSVTMPSAVGNFKQKQEFLDLEAYFPFDPLVLPMSKKIVGRNFVEWSEVNPEEEDDEDSGSGSHMDDDDDEEEDDEDDDEEEEDSSSGEDGDSSSDEEEDDDDDAMADE